MPVKYFEISKVYNDFMHKSTDLCTKIVQYFSSSGFFVFLVTQLHNYYSLTNTNNDLRIRFYLVFFVIVVFLFALYSLRHTLLLLTAYFLVSTARLLSLCRYIERSAVDSNLYTVCGFSGL